MTTGRKLRTASKATFGVPSSKVDKKAMGGRRWGKPLARGIEIEGIEVCRDGVAVAHDEAALLQAARGPEIEYEVALPGHGADAEVFFSDLGHEYVRINAEYTT